MSRLRTWIALAGFVVLLAACAKAPVETATPVPTEPETAEPTAVVEAQIDQTDYCLDCHTNKDSLISTAKPEEEAGEKESEGVG